MKHTETPAMPAQRARGTDRILEILSYFETNTEAASRNALAIALDCPRTTIYTLVDQLIGRGWLVQGDAGALRLGYRAGLLGLTYASQEPFESAAREIIQRVAAYTGEVAEINVIENWRQLVLISAAGRGMTYLRIVEGSRYPLPLTSSARVQLSDVPFDWLKQSIPAGDFQTGPGQIIRYGDFFADIDAAREQGFAVVRGTIDPFLGAISVPIRNAHGSPVAAISLVLPVEKIADGQAELKDTLCQAAQELEQLLRLRGWPLGEALLRDLKA